MNSSTRRIAALVGATAMAAGLAVLAPAAANAATTTYQLDCDNLPGYRYQSLYVVPGDTITLDVVGYDTVTPNGGLATPIIGGTVELESGDDVVFSGEGCEVDFSLDVSDAAPATVPSGSLLGTRDATIPLSPREFTVTEDQDYDHYLGGDRNCAVEVYDHGKHVYGTIDIEVTQSGEYTFRGLSNSPVGDYNSLSPFDPIGDPFLAVYKDFDPANPDVGVIGCNDDANDVGDEEDAQYLADGTIIEGHLPYFTAQLEPGHYTLLLATYTEISAEEFAEGYSSSESADFVVGPKTVAFQFWGPEGGVSFLDDAPVPTEEEPAVAAPAKPALAETGFDGTPAVAALLLLIGGAATVLVARRRGAAQGR